MDNNEELRSSVDTVVKRLVSNINPYDRTKDCLKKLHFNDGKKILISIGKAAWTMGKAISDNLEIDDGAVITKYNHSKGEIGNVKIFEAGHPISDENSINATSYVLEITKNLTKDDNVILCISGGGSALFEKPLIPLNLLQDINNQLIKSGADINEINTIRKKLSQVKAGRFAVHCEPANIQAIILSDVIGNDLSTIASGPVSVDNTDPNKALEIVNKYQINVDNKVKELLNKETPQNIDNVETYIIGSVEQLCDYTELILQELGYKTHVIQNNCKDNIVDIASKFKELLNNNTSNNQAYIIGGESVVNVKGNGLGGRNTELALLCAEFIKDKENVCIFTFGSDGTDGPTDVAGGYVDGNTYNKINVNTYLDNNDSYHALQKTDGLIITGPTGSNVNDIYVLLIN